MPVLVGALGHKPVDGLRPTGVVVAVPELAAMRAEPVP